MSNVLLNKGYEEYLISNMRKYQDNLPLRAKGWISAARSLFPNDFRIQYEAYKMERDWSDAHIAANYFSELVKKFSEEPEMLKEMLDIVEALKVKIKTEKGSFLKKMFRNLSSDVKYSVLSTVASQCDDPMEHCCTMLLLLQELPNEQFKHGEKVINTLLSSENVSHCNHPINPYRNLLVCNATPSILFIPNFRLLPKLLICLLQASLEFYVSYIFTMPDQELENDILKKCNENEEPIMAAKNVNNIWKSMFLLIKNVGQQLNWTLVELFSSKLNLVLEMNWEKTLQIVRKRLFSEGEDSMSAVTHEGISRDKEVFFTMAAIFFYALYQFSKMVSPKFFPKPIGMNHYVLIEGVRSGIDDESSENVTKKFKYDKDSKKSEKSMSISVSQSCPEMGENLVQSFVMAVKLWEWMQRNYCLGKDFSHLCQVIEMDKWPCFQEFYIDLLIYQGCHKDAITNLTHILNSVGDDFEKNKTCLQLASCLNHVNERVRACEYLFDVISSLSLPISNREDVQAQSLQQFSMQQLHFISYSLDDILHFTVELLISIYKKKIRYIDHEGIVLGHLIILSQHKWPQEKELFMQCLKQIRQNGSFCFAKFFDYVINSFMLEEFMYITSSHGGSITLDLLPTSAIQIGKQRAITRGLNKGAKDDLKEAMKKQMMRCNESMEKLFVTFIMQERHHINRIIA